MAGPNIIQLSEFDVTQRIIASLSNVCTRAVLFCVRDEAKDAARISRDLGISLSGVYKAAATLEELALLDVERYVISGAGKKTKMYRSRIGKVDIVMQGAEPVLRLHPVAR